ncbi:MAG: protoporphyrinogen oxidase [Acidimicrobiales bacterium]
MKGTVAVVGGGIAGLAAAWELTGGGDGPGADTPRVVVLEAADRLGGKLASAEFEGRTVDLAADGFLARRPEATELCHELGLDPSLAPVGRSGAAVWVGGRRRTLPAGLVLGVPTRLWPVARARVLGPAGVLRLSLDVLAPRPDRRGPLGDRAIGPLVARKLGRRTVARLVEPLVGGIHAGGVEDMSTAAVFPLLLAVPPRGGLMRGLRRAAALGVGPGGALPSRTDGAPADERPGGGGPAFWALAGGMQQLVDALTADLERRGVALRTGMRVVALGRRGPPRREWALTTSGGPVTADGLVLAVPAGPAASLLEPHDAEVAGLLRGVDHASVAVVTLAVRPEDLPEPLDGTGLLVPRHSPLPRQLATEEDRTFLVTACTYLSAKWPHLARRGDVLVRASVGRVDDERAGQLDDEQLVARVTAELGVLLGLAGAPVASMVSRWPDALPQYRVHHLLRVTAIEAAAGRLPALAVAGAAYRGVGIPACVGSGRAAARRVRTALDDASGPVGADR